jgi:hypothetical protein
MKPIEAAAEKLKEVMRESVDSLPEGSIHLRVMEKVIPAYEAAKWHDLTVNREDVPDDARWVLLEVRFRKGVVYVRGYYLPVPGWCNDRSTIICSSEVRAWCEMPKRDALPSSHLAS